MWSLESSVAVVDRDVSFENFLVEIQDRSQECRAEIQCDQKLLVRFR